MDKQLIVKNNITIQAPVSKVWDVLVKPQYVKQWDELPEDFGDEPLKMGREVVWHQDNDQQTKLTVTGCEPNKLLRLSLYSTRWRQPPTAFDIAYTYNLSQQGGGTFLSISIGDFAQLPNGQNYYNESVKFAESALYKIKQLSE